MNIELREVEIGVEGYGVLKVKIPEEITDESISDLIGETVAEVMNLIDPRTQTRRFHPALGFGGYVRKDSGRAI